MSSLVTLTEPRSATAEAYRALRTNLAFARPGEPLRSLLIAAPSVHEDASSTLANLAVVTAQAGRRVLVVDADLRRPSQHALFGVDDARGVTTTLVGEVAVEDCLQATAVEGLRVLASGPLPPNPAELLGGRGMTALLERVASLADLVLFDAPPLLPVTDGAVLAPRLDGVLLVLAAGRSRRDHAARARAVLDNVGARLIGVVLTDASPATAGYPTYGSGGA
jgi:capsular exopolysaccharide synthesis family protein